MADGRLDVALRRFQRTVDDCQRFADDARRWSLPGASPHISRARRDSIIEMAFLQSFLAWESFLEETFLLFMTGNKPSRGRAPTRYVSPPDRQAARTIAAEGRPFPKWNVSETRRRALAFFRNGRPYDAVLRGSQQALQDLNTVRNAVAHESDDAWDKFRDLVRRELTVLPVGLTVGGYLNTVRPGTAPPAAFMEYYLGTMVGVGERIVRP